MFNTNSTATTAAATTAQNLVSRKAELKDGLAQVQVIMRGPCGEAVLPKGGIMLDGEEVSSKAIKSNTLQWFPTDALAFKGRLYMEADRTLQKFGVEWGKKTYLVPLARLEELETELAAIGRQFEAEVDAVTEESAFASWVQAQKDAYPEVAAFIDKMKADAAEFKARFVFKVTPPIAFKPLYEEDCDEVNASIADSLYESVAKQAEALYKKSFAARAVATQKIRSPFRALVAKLTSLAFVDRGVIRIVDKINEVLDALPKAGLIEGRDLDGLARWTLVMADVDRLKLHASGIDQAEPEVEEEPELDADTTTTVTVVNDEGEVEVKAIAAISISPDATQDELDFGGW